MKKRVFLLFLLSIILLMFSCGKSETPDAKIIFTSIGKADCEIIMISDKVAVIDTGEKEDYPKIKSALENCGIKKIDYLILSHFDKDHIGGVCDLIRDYPIYEIHQTSIKGKSSLYDDTEKAIEDKGITLCSAPQNNDTFTSEIHLENCTLTLYYPKKASYDEKEDNNASIITRLDTNEKSVLFFGDAMEERLGEFIEDNKKTCDLIKAPYHGNYISNYKELIDNCKFSSAVITSSAKNPESEDVLSLLKENNIKYYLTRNGQITATIFGSTIKIK